MIKKSIAAASVSACLLLAGPHAAHAAPAQAATVAPTITAQAPAAVVTKPVCRANWLSAWGCVQTALQVGSWAKKGLESGNRTSYSDVSKDGNCYVSSSNGSRWCR